MPPLSTPWTPQALQQIRRRLVAWYQLHHRQLPWRETSDPYAIWVSEIMLQQTQVATVLGYFARFLARFPDVHTLAAAEEQEIFALWAGLGYYRRARQMHAAAQVIVEQYAGEFPQDLDAIEGLPGIGRYTAGAIVSFAFDQPAPIVEANTARLFSRLMAIRQPVQERDAQRQLWQFAEDLLPKRSSGSGLTNQAAMELGSQVCGPTPECDRCPLTRYCRAFAAGEQLEIPPVKQKAPPTPLTHIAVVIRSRKGLLLRENAAGEWWHGLWDLPRIDVSQTDVFDFMVRPGKTSRHAVPLSPAAQQTIVRGYSERFGVQVEPQLLLRGLQHSVTRYRITLYCVSATLSAVTTAEAVGVSALPAGWAFHPLDQLPPLTSPAKRIVGGME